MRRIEKKLWQEYFQLVLDGKKTFELRLADFDINEGDILILKEWDHLKKEYTGREIEKEVTYIAITKGAEKFWSKEKIDEHGFQIISWK